MKNNRRLKELKRLCDIARKQKDWGLCSKYHDEEMEILNKSLCKWQKVLGISLLLLFTLKIIAIITHI